MNFMDAVATCFSKYVDFAGRASRPEFWWFVLFNFLVSLVLRILGAAILGHVIGEMLESLYSLAVLLPSLAVGARRLHDTDRSGWWQLIGVVPLLGWIVLIWFFAQPGTRTPNKYGA